MLLGEQGSGNQYRHLLAVLHCDKGGAHRHFGLAETNVPADKAIGGAVGRHVGNNGIDGGLLIGGFLERKAFAERFVIQL